MRGIILFLLPLVRAQLDTSVCTPITPSTDPNTPVRPAIPNTFDVHVDCIIVNKNMTTEVHEYFDDVNNRGYAEQFAYGERFKAYYDYSHNEFIGMFPDAGTCSVSNLSTSDQRFLFGYETDNGTGHIYTASGALHFKADQPEQYQGLEQVRGIWCQTWYSCQYWADMKASMNVTWYFSDPSAWDTALGISQVPVRSHVKGIVHDSAVKSHPFEHYYEFIHFRDSIENPRVFELDDSAVCPGRINTKPLPTVPDVLTMLVEQVDVVQKTVSFTSEWFDSRTKLTRFDMRPTALSASRFGTNRLSIVRDFNTGIMYVKDIQLGNCTVTPLNDDGWDDRMQDPQHVRIANAQEFFHFNSTYVYMGVKNVRGVDCDTWISERTDFPSYLPSNSTWEWAFVTQNWTSGADKLSYYQTAIPFRLSLKVPALGIEYEMNVFRFNGQEPSVLDYDISNCMATERRRTFRVSFPKQYTAQIMKNVPSFRYQSLVAIMTAASVSSMRITNIQITNTNGTAHLVFDFTDLPPVKGDVNSDYYGLSLDVVASEFIRSVKGGTFKIQLIPDNQNSFIAPAPGTLEEMTVGPTPFVTRPPITSRPPTTQAYTPPPKTNRPQTNRPHTNRPQTNKPRTYKPPRTNGPTIRPHTQRPGTTPWNPFPGVSSLNQLCSSQSAGYSAGVMAGVAVTMVVFGGAGGGVLAILLKRKRIIR